METGTLENRHQFTPYNSVLRNNNYVAPEGVIWLIDVVLLYISFITLHMKDHMSLVSFSSLPFLFAWCWDPGFASLPQKIIKPLSTIDNTLLLFLLEIIAHFVLVISQIEALHSSTMSQSKGCPWSDALLGFVG